MLNRIILKNLKCFREVTSIPLSKINLFTGVNGKGKSTAIQSLLLIRQSVEINRVTQNVYFNGNCVELGTFKDIKNVDVPTKEPIILTYVFCSEEGEFKISYNLASDEADDMSAAITKVLIKGIFKNKSFETVISKQRKSYKIKHNGKDQLMRWSDLLFNREVIGNDQYLKFIKSLFNLTKIHYVSADRLGPQDFYIKTNISRFINVGNRGQYTANILAFKKDDLVSDALCLEGYPKSLPDQTEGWLSTILGGGKISVSTTDASIVLVQMNSNSGKQLFKPMNVGFGYSYILPIIVSALIAQKDTILIIENPEAHLHPRAQSQLIKFLARVACSGVQVVIESHSDHIFNGLRVAVVDKEINLQHTDVKVTYFTGGDQCLEEIEIQSDGSVTNWPDDFFDQTDKDFRIIFGM